MARFMKDSRRKTGRRNRNMSRMSGHKNPSGSGPKQDNTKVNAGEKSKKWTIPKNIQQTIGDLSPAERKELAKELGYRQIGKPVPDSVSLVDVIKTFPEEVYQLDYWRAWGALALTVAAIILGYTCVAYSPWYMLPLAWFFTGTASTGLFVLGHDCAHQVFHKKAWINDVVGYLVLTPLIYPYEPWKIMHNLHHVHTNKLHKDTGWQPVMVDQFPEGSFAHSAVKFGLATPLKLWLSIGHWLKLHFNPFVYTKEQIKMVVVSWLLCFGFAAYIWTALYTTLGFAGWCKFWLMPWLGYHFWMSTFTLIHHTAPHIPFQTQDSYNGAQAKLGGTVHCDFPRWIEVLCHDINVHVPHHLSARIPFYNLRKATDSLRKNWGQYMTETSINWRMMRNFITEIHLYDVGKEYVAFDAGNKPDPLLTAQRWLLPKLP